MTRTTRSPTTSGGMSRVELGEYDGAIEDFDRAAKLDPNHPSVTQERAVAVKMAKSNSEGNDTG